MTKTLLPFALFVGLAFPACAEETEAPAKDTSKKPTAFELADTDKDGKLSEAEFVAMMLKQFVAMDKDENKELGGDELGPDPSPIVTSMDKNKDAKITETEFTEAVKGLFKDLDTNEDKGMTKGELAVLEAVTKGSGTRKPKDAPKPETGN